MDGIGFLQQSNIAFFVGAVMVKFQRIIVVGMRNIPVYFPQYFFGFLSFFS